MIRLFLVSTVLLISSCPAFAQTWDGGGANNNWSTANNWNPNGVPANNGTANLVFAGTTRLTPNLDQNFSISSLAFTGGSGSTFTLGGSGTLTIGTGGIQQSSNFIQRINHGITLNGNQTWGVNGALILGGNIDGTGNFTKTGGEALTLLGSASYTGSTVVSDGFLIIGNGGTTGSVSGQITNNSLVNFNRSDSYLHSGNIVGSGETLISGSGTMVATGIVTSNIRINPNSSLQVGDGGTSGSIDTEVSNLGTLIFNRSDNVTSAVIITGFGHFVKKGAGRLTLARPQVYTGPTTIETGTLISNNMYGSLGLPLTVNSGASLEANGIIQRNIAGSGSILATGTLLIGSFSASGYDFAGQLAIGSNTVQLLDSNFAQLGNTTTISNGRLTSLNGIHLGPAVPAHVDSSKILSASGNSTIEGSFTNRGLVNGPTGAGQFLTFTGDVNGAGNYTGNIIFSDGFSPGDSPAIVNFQSLTLDNTASLTMEIGGTIPGARHDQLIASTAMNLGGDLSLELINGFVPLPGQQFLLLENRTANPINGTFSGLAEGSSFMSDGQLWQISYRGGTGNDLVLTAVPEPATIIISAIPVLAALAFWLRRRHNSALADSTLDNLD